VNEPGVGPLGNHNYNVNASDVFGQPIGITRIERGTANPTEKTLVRIADALGADLRFVERVTS
jgi:transcriptional regulator with XRE-family HTH domain